MIDSVPAVHLLELPAAGKERFGDMINRPESLYEFEKEGPAELLYKPWWQEGLYFSCIGCGRCCRGEPGAVWLSPGEIEVIAAHLGLEKGSFLRDFDEERRGRKSLKERPNRDFVIYDTENARRGIYSVRPLQCRLFPFWPSLLRTRQGWIERSLECPGMDQGRFWSDEKISTLLAQSPFPEL